MTDPRIEAAARVLCEIQYGEEFADMLAPSVKDAPIDDHDDDGVPCHFVWRQFEHRARAAIEAAGKAESDTYNVPGNTYESAVEGRKAFRQKYREAREALIEARKHLRKNRSSWNGPQFQAIWAINAALGEDPAEDRPFHQPLPTPPESGDD